MSSDEKPVAPEVRVSELVLHVTITQPVARFKTEDAIDSSAVPDERSAIDQFVSTIETLNIVIARHSAKSDLVSAVSEPVTSEALESLLSLDDQVEDVETDDVVMQDEAKLSGVVKDASSEADAGQADSTSLAGVSVPPLAEDDVTRQLNNLVFLGYMSAVESYFRCLTRQLVWVDELTSEKVKDLKITYSAARHAEPMLLAEALLEDMTFITMDSIKNLLKDVIGIPSQGIEDVILEYDRICQLRHCIVHRFGRLGSKNASKLGLSTHKGLFEKPIRLARTQLEQIAFSLLNFVRALNNHIYAKVLERSAGCETKWTWDVDKDLPNFESIYSVFKKAVAPSESPPAVEAYSSFKAKCERTSATVKSRGLERRKEREKGQQ